MRYIRDFKDMYRNTLITLSYEAHMPPPFQKSQESDNTTEYEAKNPNEKKTHRRRPRPSLLGKPIISRMRILPLQIKRESIENILNPVRGGNFILGKPSR